MAEDTNQALDLNSAAEKMAEVMYPEGPNQEPTDEVAEEAAHEVEAQVETEEPETTAEDEATIESEDVVEETPYAEFINELNEWIADPDSNTYFEGIKLRTKVNGEDGEVTLKDALASYQIGTAAEERLSSLKSERAAFDTEREQYNRQITEELKKAVGLVEGLERKIVSRFEGVNWDELRQTDPAEYAALQTEAQQARAEIDAYKNAITSKHRETMDNNYREIVSRESEKLVERIPTWSDESVAKEEKLQIRSYLLENGFRAGEVDGEVDSQGNIINMGLVDSRLVDIARKAYLYDKTTADVALAKKRTMKVPRVAKPGKPQTRKEAVSKADKEKMARLRKTGDVNDAAALINSRFFGE